MPPMCIYFCLLVCLPRVLVHFISFAGAVRPPPSTTGGNLEVNLPILAFNLQAL